MDQNLFEDISLQEATFVALDIETSGKYPIEAEICELGAVKWQGGKIVDRYSTLVKPKRVMSQEVINIHHITNEMVKSAPAIDAVIGDFHKFVGNAFCIAHHAPFDLGFLSIDFESKKLALPEAPVFCTSLLAQALVTESPNFRLGTLVQVLNVPLLNHHRASDDAEACLGIFLKIVDRVGWLGNVGSLLKRQHNRIRWADYSLAALGKREALSELIEALRANASVELVYEGGSKKGQPRTVRPVGIVRNPKGDFLVGDDGTSSVPKRYFLDKISSAKRNQ